MAVGDEAEAYHPAMQRDFEAFTERQLQAYLQGLPLEAVVTVRDETA